MTPHSHISIITPVELHEFFKGWVYSYLASHLSCNFADFHDDWFKLLSEKRVGIAAPRSFAKSFIMSFFYPLFMALENKCDILLVSATGALAEWFLAKIKAELENNQLIVKDFGVQKGEVWRNDHVRLANGSIIRAKGAEYQIRGFRPTHVIVDDIETDEGVWSEDQRNKLSEWFWRALVNTLEKDSQLIVVGTLLHPLSFLAQLLIAKREGWVTRKYVAMIDEESTWKEKWPTHELKKRRDEIGTPAFEQEYQNNPIPDAWRTFKPEYVKFYETVPKGLSYSTTVDPAIALGEKSDYTAIVTVGVDSDGFVYVVDYTRKRLLPMQVIKEILRHFVTYSPHTIGIETVGFQKMLRYAFDEECKRRNLYPYVKELKLDVSEKGRKKRFRIEALEPYFQRGKILFSRNMKELESELLSFPTGKHDDIIDALASQIELMTPGEQEKSDIPHGCFLEHWQSKKRKLRRINRWH